MRCYTIPKKPYEKETIREYKKQYYLKNKQIYTTRNRREAQKLTIDRIEKLASEDIIYKLEYLLNNLDLW